MPLDRCPSQPGPQWVGPLSEGSFPGSEWVPRGICVSVRRHRVASAASGTPVPEGGLQGGVLASTLSVFTRSLMSSETCGRWTPGSGWGLPCPLALPCPASVSTWTPGCAGGQGGPAANVGSSRWSLIRPQPCPGNRLQSPPSMPRGGPALGSHTRDERASPAPRSPLRPLSWGTGLPAACC